MSISTLFLTIVCTCVEVNSDGQADIKMSLSGGLTMIIVLLIVINKTVYLFETLIYFIFYPPLSYFIFYPPLIASFQWRLKSSSTCGQLQRRGCCWPPARAATGTRWSSGAGTTHSQSSGTPSWHPPAMQSHRSAIEMTTNIRKVFTVQIKPAVSYDLGMESLFQNLLCTVG